MRLLKSALSISALTFLSRILGLVRDILIAGIFGASALTDAFWVAFRIPNLLRRLFAEGAFSQAFVPILAEVKNQENPDKTQTFIAHTALLLTCVLMLVCLLGIIFAPALVYLLGSGLESNQFDIASQMTRIMFPYILCMSLVALISGILNTWQHFAIPAFTPVLLNVSIISTAIFLSPYIQPSILALPIGVMVGGVLQLSIQLYALKRLGLFPKFNFNLKAAYQNSQVQKILRKMAPALLGVSVAQISILINTNIATWLPAGSVSWLSFSDRLMEFPTALLGVAFSTILLPSLSNAHFKGNTEQYNQLINWGLKMTCLLGLPSAVGLYLLSEGLVSTLFHYGAFDTEDVLKTAQSVSAYGVGLIGILSVKILAPAYFAKQDIKTPVKISLMVLCVTQLFNLILVPYLHHVGLALSVGLGALCNAGLLLFFLRRANKGFYFESGWILDICKMCLGLIVMGAWLIWIQQYITWTSNVGTLNQYISFALSFIGISSSMTLQRLICLCIVIIVSMVTYFITLIIIRLPLKTLIKKQL